MFGKGKDDKRGIKGTLPLQVARSPQANDQFDASPDVDQLADAILNEQREREGSSHTGSKPNGSGPRSIQDTKIWQDSVGGLRGVWESYVSNLATYFRNMTRIEQEQTIIKFCNAITIGTAILSLSIFYYFLPQPLRVLSLPVVVCLSWFAGARIVGPQMIIRFSRFLNPYQ